MPRVIEQQEAARRLAEQRGTNGGTFWYIFQEGRFPALLHDVFTQQRAATYGARRGRRRPSLA